jgi:hypothetical protein
MDKDGNGFRCWFEWIEMGTGSEVGIGSEMGMSSDVGTDPKGDG